MAHQNTLISSLKTGDLIDTRYQLIEPLREGGQGLVWLSNDVRLKKRVAQKFFALEDNNDRAMFQDEVRLAAALAGHPNICAILDIGQMSKDRDTIDYIIFELMEDGDISDLAGSGDIHTRLQVGLDICHGLRHMHVHNFAHRDLKPSNVLRAPGGRVKLGDFGVAKDLTIPTRTFTRGGVGTFLYRAPEDLRGDERFEKLRADIYQLGVTLYELFSGRVPFRPAGIDRMDRQDAVRALLGAIDAHNVAPLTDHGFSPSLWQLINEMLQANPKTRPESMQHICARMQAELIRTSGEADVVIERNMVRDVRRAITDKVSQMIHTLVVDDDSPLTPEYDEDKNWYAFGLVRPVQPEASSTRLPQSLFHSVYLAWLNGSSVMATMDWTRTPNRLANTLRLDRCCSGFVVRAYDEYADWKREGILDDGFVTIAKGDGNTIRYIILSDVRTARRGAASAGARLIRDHYALGRRDASGNPTPFVFSDGQGRRHPMSDSVQVEVIVPVYAPKAERKRGPNDIFGVLNFEWVHPLSKERRTDIAEYLARAIHEERLFPITEFVASIVGLVAPANDPEILVSTNEDA